MTDRFCDSCGNPLDGDVVYAHRRLASPGRAHVDGPRRAFHPQCFERAASLSDYRREDGADTM